MPGVGEREGQPDVRVNRVSLGFRTADEAEGRTLNEVIVPEDLLQKEGAGQKVRLGQPYRWRR